MRWFLINSTLTHQRLLIKCLLYAGLPAAMSCKHLNPFLLTKVIFIFHLLTKTKPGAWPVIKTVGIIDITCLLAGNKDNKNKLAMQGLFEFSFNKTQVCEQLTPQ
jgi:hypothetical protein